MKRVYIINLDKSRIALISAVLLFGAAALFWSGRYLERIQVAGDLPYGYPGADRSVTHNSNEFTGGVENRPYANTSAMQNGREAGAQKRAGVTSGQPNRELPGEDLELFREKNHSGNITFHADPFLNDEKNHYKSDKGQNAGSSLNGVYYSIQAGAYVHEKDAIRFQRELKKKGYDARVDRGIRFYYVRIGRSQNKEALEAMNKKIQDTMKLESILVQRGS